MTATMALHCPKCSGDMATYERSGITVDQCRECRGIFLDRGELEKLVDAEGGAWVGPQPGVPAQAVHAAPPPLMPAGHLGMPQGYRGSPRARSAELQPAWHDNAGRAGYRPESDGTSNGMYGRPSKRRSILGELLEGFGD